MYRPSLSTRRDKRAESLRFKSLNPKLICHNVRAESLKLSTRGKIKKFVGTNGRIKVG